MNTLARTGMKRHMTTTESRSVISPMCVLVAGLVWAFSGLAAPALPPNWWTSMTPAEIVCYSEQITEGLKSYRAAKPLSPEKDIDALLLVRRNAAGQTEKKYTIFSHGKPVATEWVLPEGHYNYWRGVLQRLDFSTSNWIDEVVAAVPNPYEWNLAGSEQVGTNDCLVLVGIATRALLEKASNTLSGIYGQAPPDAAQLPLMESFPYERRIYVRKLDGVKLGEWQNNQHGFPVAGSMVFQVFEANIPLSEEDFKLPDVSPIPVTNWTHMIMTMSGQVPGPSPKPLARYLILAGFFFISCVFVAVLCKTRSKNT